MKDSIPGWALGFALALCCALPLLLVFGALSFAGGFVLNERVLFGLGVSLVALAGIVFLALRKRSR